MIIYWQWYIYELSKALKQGTKYKCYEHLCEVLFSVLFFRRKGTKRIVPHSYREAFQRPSLSSTLKHLNSSLRSPNSRCLLHSFRPVDPRLQNLWRRNAHSFMLWLLLYFSFLQVIKKIDKYFILKHTMHLSAKSEPLG